MSLLLNLIIKTKSKFGFQLFYMNIKNLLFLTSLFIVCQLHSQDFQGKAFYVFKSSEEINLDGRNIPQHRKEMIKERMKAALEKEFELTFDSSTSMYKEQERLQTSGANGFGMMYSYMGGNSELFKDLAKQRYTRKEELFGKIFLIQDSLPKRKWQLGAETKKIGQYTCYKASYTRKVKNHFGGWGSNSNNDASSDSVVRQAVTVTAWYTMEIPVSSGPNLYGGLPGLILEINDHKTTILCAKVVLNPKKKLTIKPPKKGKKVSQKEFNKIREKKVKEMREQFQKRKGQN